MAKTTPKNKIVLGNDRERGKTQVYVAVIAYTLIAIIRQKIKTTYTTYEVLQILGISLLDKTSINQPLAKISDQDVKEHLHKQLKIW